MNRHQTHRDEYYGYYRVRCTYRGWEVLHDESDGSSTLTGLFASYDRAVKYANRRAKHNATDADPSTIAMLGQSLRKW